LTCRSIAYVWLLAHGEDRVGLETGKEGREHIVPTSLYLPWEVGAVPRLVGCASCTVYTVQPGVLLLRRTVL